MPRIVCRNCHMEYNTAVGVCPNCGVRPLPAWRRLLGWRWPFPLALLLGLVLQLVAHRTGSDRAAGHAAAVPLLTGISQFLTGIAMFTLLCVLAFGVLGASAGAIRRRAARHRRARRAD